MRWFFVAAVALVGCTGDDGGGGTGTQCAGTITGEVMLDLNCTVGVNMTSGVSFLSAGGGGSGYTLNLEVRIPGTVSAGTYALSAGADADGFLSSPEELAHWSATWADAIIGDVSVTVVSVIPHGQQMGADFFEIHGTAHATLADHTQTGHITADLTY